MTMVDKLAKITQITPITGKPIRIFNITLWLKLKFELLGTFGVTNALTIISF